ncbi:putative RNA methylase [Methanococcus aeolicus Nankai-3]|uniref:tRNA (guanine(10)-N(2))-dimethyltransferase n=1 Tax=Methanococcus aeolicus (strain ATCC BAA-1280 / DSM 17508 / OCM 812 / Nankai-3) TaxID=419665 RepID=A6UUS9_META3|nr:THUMP domain-containing protein [Methanococcus aeolicus]ABR56251.1 putative RNA methylase [Methanococcus aeolicus Nankai-3]
MNNNNKIGFLLSKEFDESKNFLKENFYDGKTYEISLTLPKHELTSLLNTSGKYPITTKNNYVIVDGLNEKEGANIIDKGAYINECHLILFGAPSLNELYEKLNNFDFRSAYPILPEHSFAVRTLKIIQNNNIDSGITSMDIERKVGAIIKNKTNSPVNLKNPDKTIKIIILDNIIYFAILINERNKEYYLKNRPHLRAYFHPGCILPKLARCMVNMAQLKEGDIILDPFCGTGGFLIEGGLIGCKLIGSDIDNRMVQGALLNLKTYELDNNVISIKQWDALDAKNYLKSLNIEKVDTIITDPPYGMSTAKKGDIEHILNNLKECLKDGGYLIFASPTILNLEDLELEGLYSIYIHKSLTRYIHIYKK